MKVGKIFGYTLFAGVLTLPLMLQMHYPGRFYYFLLFLTVLFGSLAAIHFFQHLHKPLEYRYSSDPYPLYIGPLLWGFSTAIIYLSAGWYWLIPVVLLMAVQLLFWQKYPYIPRKKPSFTYWLNPLAGLFVVMAISMLIIVFQVAGKYAWSIGSLNPLKLVSMVVLALLSLPMCMALAMVPIFRKRIHNNTPVRKETTLGDQVKLLDWQNITVSLNILERAEAESGYHLLPAYAQALDHFPRAWYHLSERELSSTQLLEKMIQRQMEKLIVQNAPYTAQPQQCWCEKHFCRATAIQYGEYAVTLCRICNLDQHLLYPVAKAIGVMGDGNPSTEHHSEWHFPTWDPTTGTFVPGDYDEIWMQAGSSVNPDWYVTAMVAWLDNYYSVTEKTIPIMIHRKIPMGENARKLLEVAAEEGKIELKWVG